MISKLEINGYRLLQNFTAELRPLTVVIGANATGKSTLLDCLQCISQCAELPLDKVTGWRWGLTSMLNAGAEEQKLSWKITIDKPGRLPWVQLPLEVNHPYVYEVVLKSNTQAQVIAQYEVLKNPVPIPGKAEPLKYLEATPYRRVIFNKQHQLAPFDEAVPSPTAVQEVSGETPASVDGESPVQARERSLLLSQIRFINDYPVPSAVRLLLVNMAFYTGFDVTPASALRTKAAEIKPVATLFPNGENLGTVLHEILTRYDYRSAADDLREFFHAAYPNFEEIHCDTTFGMPPQVLVRVREKSMKRSMELWELSDGMLRFLCLATALLSPTVAPLIALDEPEIGLHPRLLGIVADMVKTASERTQVIVTTHSPELLTHFAIDDVAVMTRSETEPRTNWHRPADNSALVNLLKSVTGETLGELHRSGELEAV